MSTAEAARQLAPPAEGAAPTRHRWTPEPAENLWRCISSGVTLVAANGEPVCCGCDAAISFQEIVNPPGQPERLGRLLDLYRFASETEEKLGARYEIAHRLLEAEGSPARTQAHVGISKEKLTQAEVLVRLADDAELFHAPDGEVFATIPVRDHSENWRIRSKGFRRWLVRRFYEKHKKPPSSQPLAEALGLLEAQAQFDSCTYPVFSRVAERAGRIYLDLCDERWRAVEVGPDGWRLVDHPSVKFRRARGMLPLPEPATGGSIDRLQDFLNIASNDKESWRLILGWLVAALRPRGPYPVLIAHGEQGSAKSTGCRFLRALVDPNTAPMRTTPRDEHDLMIAATNGWIVAFDNLGHLEPWLSDAICRLATGGGFATRELYTDQEEILFDAMRPVMLNGIEELATRGDLLDRSLILYLPAIPEEKRRDEKLLWAEFESARPGILGALLNAVSTGLREESHVKLDRLPRMADFAKWVTAAAPALGWKPDEFIHAYAGNRDAANELTLEASPVASELLKLADEIRVGQDWKGSASELLHKLNCRVTDEIAKQRGWLGLQRA